MKLLLQLRARKVLSMLVAFLPIALAKPDSAVTVDFYGESLCPYCINFTLNVVEPLINSNVSQYFTLRYIPYGNARYDVSKGAFLCQHGPAECEINTLLSCVIDAYPAQAAWFPIVSCIEEEARRSRAVDSAIKQCLNNSSTVSTDVIACAKGKRGFDLQLKAKSITDKLVPPHKWVPWVVVNGIPLPDDYDNLLSYVCIAIPEPRPAACYAAPSEYYLGRQPRYTLAEKYGRDPFLQ